MEEAGGEEGDILGYFRYEGILDRGASSRDADAKCSAPLYSIFTLFDSSSTEA